MSEIFVGFKVSLDAQSDQVSDKAIAIFTHKPVIRMGPENGHLAPLDKQGSGARRTMLWSALKIASERQTETAKRSKKSSEVEADGPTRPHVLLLDEPEICLHPSAIRDACRVLYDLSSKEAGWQVMVTTHSPQFIDVSRDNTTIVRVERKADGNINGTTVFRPERVSLSGDEKELLKLLNQWDPYVGEFFFGGRTIIVEGDTEYSAFREIIENDRKKYRNVHVVRARGKYIIPPLVKIMNHFGSPYAVLHDTDTPTNPNGQANSAWTANTRIAEAVACAPVSENVRLAACVIDFEHAMFGEGAIGDKPYKTVCRIREDATARLRVTELLDYLLFDLADPPAGVLAWKGLQELEVAVAAENPVVPENLMSSGPEAVG